MLKKFSGSILYLLISVLIISLYLDRHKGFEKLEHSIQDTMAKIRGPRPASSDIVLIGIDDASVKLWGKWPWKRDNIARFLNDVRAQDPKTIVLDLTFGPDPSQQGSSTDSLAKAMTRAQNVVIGYHYSQNDIPRGAMQFPGGLARNEYVKFDNIANLSEHPPLVASRLYPPESTLADCAATMGFINITIENDRKIRLQPLIIGYRGEFFPSIQMAAAANYLNVNPGQINVKIGDALVVGQKTVLTDSRGCININFNGPRGTFKYYSAAEIIRKTVRRGDLTRKLVLIGYVGAGTTEIYSTPVSSQLSGLELDANIIENILHGSYLHGSTGRYNINLIILFLIGLFYAALLPRVSFIIRILILSVTFAAVFATNYLLFSSFNLVMSTFYPALEIFFFLAAAPILRPFGEPEKKKKDEEDEVDYESLLSSSQSIPVDNWPVQNSASRYNETISNGRSASGDTILKSQSATSYREKTMVATADAPSTNHFGRYKVIKPIGKGAMGTVYKGLDPAIDRLVALKTIRLDNIAEQDEMEELRQRLIREAKAAGKLSHPNVVTIYYVGEEGSLQYIAMEYLEGSTLESLLKRGLDWDYRMLSKVMIQACEALDYAHENGIVHRDIKPANIMILEGNKVKVMDFGIARLDKSASMTHEGTTLGTPNYISPEQLKGQPVDRRSDIFSLGVVFYEVLTGEKPFKGDTISALIYSILHTEPPRPSEINLDIPRIFDKIVAKAMVKDPDVRFQRAKEIADILRKLI